jgi:hypothetical protein
MMRRYSYIWLSEPIEKGDTSYIQNDEHEFVTHAICKHLLINFRSMRESVNSHASDLTEA